MNADALLDRVDVVESRVRLLQREVDEIRRELRTGQAPRPAPPPVRTVAEPFPAPRPAPPAPPKPPTPPPAPRRKLDLSDLFGPQALA